MLLGLGVLLGVAALALAGREVRSYRTRDNRDDLFIYSRGRLIRRLSGLAVLLFVGVTLGLWEVAPPRDPGTANLLLVLLLIEVVALIALAILDLRETSKTARFYRR